MSGAQYSKFFCSFRFMASWSEVLGDSVSRTIYTPHAAALFWLLYYSGWPRLTHALLFTILITFFIISQFVIPYKLRILEFRVASLINAQALVKTLAKRICLLYTFANVGQCMTFSVLFIDSSVIYMRFAADAFLRSGNAGLFKNGNF